MSDRQRVTDDELVEGITSALRAGDIDAVKYLMKALAGRNPTLAQEVLDTMRLGVDMRDGE